METYQPSRSRVGGEDYDGRVAPAGLNEITIYAKGMGPDKTRVADTQAVLVVLVRQRGLVVHPYTFRAEQRPENTRRLEDELGRDYYRYDVDGLSTDFADNAVRVVHSRRRARFYPRQQWDCLARDRYQKQRLGVLPGRLNRQVESQAKRRVRYETR